MSDGIIRIKSSRQGYRRGGLTLGRDWLETDTADLTDAQKRALLGDPVLTIEGRQDDGSWTLLGAEIREGLAAVLQGVEEADAAGVQPEIGTVVDDAELDQLKADAEVGRAFIVVIGDEAKRLETLAFTDLSPLNLIPALLDVAAAHEKALPAAELGDDLSSAIADNDDLLKSLDLWPVKDPARFFIDLANQLVERDGEIARLKNTPAEEQSGGGAGDGAGPAGSEAPPAAEPAAPSKPAKAGKGGKASDVSKSE